MFSRGYMDQVLIATWFSWFWGFDFKTVQRSALCRSRRELSNECLLAKIGVYTAENEPLEVWRKIENSIHYSFASLGATQKSEQYASVVEYEAGLRRQKKRPIKVQANLARTFPEEAAWSPDMRMFTRKLPYDLALVPPWYPPRS